MNRIEKGALRDRILGAWVGKSYGAAMGEPIEFKYVGEIYEGPSDVQEVHLRDWLVNEDDLYMNMGMLKVVAERGLEATSEDFSTPYREAGYLVWHATAILIMSDAESRQAQTNPAHQIASPSSTQPRSHHPTPAYSSPPHPSRTP